MAEIPAWKLEVIRRRQQQGEDERRKQMEREEYLAKLPPWKRALVLQREKETVSKSVVAAPGNGLHCTESADKWERAAKRLQKATIQPRPDGAQQTPTATTSDTATSNATPSWRKTVTEPTASTPASSVTSSNVPFWKRSSTEKKPAEDKPPPPQPSGKVETNGEVSSAAAALAAWKRVEKTSVPAWRQSSTSSSDKLPPWKSVASAPVAVPPANKPASSSPQHSPVEATPSAPQTLATNPPEKVDVTAPSVSTGASSTTPSWKQGLASRQRTSSFPNRGRLVQPATAEEDSTPDWIRQLRLKKKQKEQQKQHQQQQQEEEPKPTSQPSTEPAIPAWKKPQPSKPIPEIVNASEKQSDSPKLVRKEGVLHRPPVFQQADKWAGVSEDDPEFKKLPPWKKAMILRRRKDIEKRTQPLPAPEPTPPSPTEKVQKADFLLAAWTTSRQSTISKQVGNEETDEPAKETKRESPSSDDTPAWLKEVRLRKTQAGTNLKVQVGQTARLPSPPRSPGLESEEEELECTAIDDESEEESEQPRSILKRSVTPVKKLRRVSFSDSELVSEHYYPKYDYSDYDDINAFASMRLGFGREETDAVSQPVHPWLANSLPTSPPPKQSTSSSLSSLSPSAYSNFGDLGSFVTAYAINKSSSASVKNDSEKSLSSRNDEQQSTPDFYANLNTDTAALIW